MWFGFWRYRSGDYDSYEVRRQTSRDDGRIYQPLGYWLCNWRQSLSVPGWFNGLIFGLLLRLPDAIITKAWIPIMTLGVIGGAIIGVIVGALGS
jgi:hypothetical protein